MTWVFFIHKRSQVFDIFKKFKNYIKKQGGRFIKTKNKKAIEVKNIPPKNLTNSMKMMEWVMTSK